MPLDNENGSPVEPVETFTDRDSRERVSADTDRSART